MASPLILCNETVALDESIEEPIHSSTKGWDVDFINETLDEPSTLLVDDEGEEGDYHPVSLLDMAILEEEGEETIQGDESIQEDEDKEQKLADKREEETLAEIVRGVKALSVCGNSQIAKKEELQQQRVSHTWVLPNFSSNLGNFLDAEHRYGSEPCALRTVLLSNGQDIGIPTIHLVNLFLKECPDDENQNNQQLLNRNLKKDGEQEGSIPEKDLFLEIIVKCVEASETDRFVYTHFKAYVESEAHGIIAEMDTPKFHLANEFIASTKVRWGLLKPTLKPGDPLQICIKHIVGSIQNPTEWGLSFKEEKIIKEFMRKGKVPPRDNAIVKNIIRNCEEGNLNLPTVAECLRATTGIVKD